MSPSKKSGPPDEPPSHIAVLLELSALGWHVTEIRPDRTEPVMWRATIRRYDGFVSITTTDVDLDAALDELKRYASVDAPTPVVHAAAGLRILSPHDHDDDDSGPGKP